MDNSKPVLALVHGFLSGPEYWQKQVDFFSAQFNVIAINLPGYSGLANQDGCEEIKDFALAAFATLDAQGVDKFYLIGHSMGGMIVQEMAHLQPERITKLVLYGTGPQGALPGRFEPIEISIEKAKASEYLSSVNNAVQSWFRYKDQDPSYAEAKQLAHKASFTTYLSGLKAMSKWNGVSYLADFTMPVLVLWGELDRSYAWEQPYQLWTEIAGASLSVINGTAHNVHIEKPALFNASVSDFLLE